MKTALVIEGGAMRGIHTVAIMDTFMQNNITFPHITAVSAGTLNGMSYVSGQQGRSKNVILGFVNDKRYYRFSNLFRGKSIYGFDFMFGELSHKYLPFDFEAYKNSPTEFYITATSLSSGDTVFFEKGEIDDVSLPSSASASLPIFSPPVEINGEKYYDGGVSNAVPYGKAFADGYEKAVILLTRHKGYRKPPVSRFLRKLYHRKFAGNPGFLEKLLTVPERYNSKMDEIDKMEEDGKAFVIRPSEPITISRLETDRKKLEALYMLGKKDAENSLCGLKRFLEIGQ